MTRPLSPDRWQRVNDLFIAAIECPVESRAAWLDHACAGDQDLRREVESLLLADAREREEQLFTTAVDAAINEAAAASAAMQAPPLVGPYRVLREIGHGGMATVFLAARDDGEFRQQVAIKVVRGALGADTRRRFRAERRILAALEHPCIARLIDGGTTADGLPYLVMEYVDGVPIDRYCHDRQLPLRERLQLFCRVCDAVSHAHHGFVVHRDLKPSNILVTPDGTPKLLDFGIAKILADEGPVAAPMTVTGMRMLTPEYASPEQVRGEPITTATDVYSLGALLFELLTGQRPLAFAARHANEVERVVCTVEPPRPSTRVTAERAARQLAGDLDTIVLTALRKEPARRYASASRLAEDIRRHLDGLPVNARPATWRYRSGRFVQRHRAGVAVAVVFALVVVGFAVALMRQVQRVSRERDTAEQVTNLLLEMYSSYDPTASRGNRVTAQELLDRGASRIQAELQGQPLVQARMLDSFGALYNNLGLPDRAADVLRASLTLRETSGEGLTLEAAETLIQLANALVLRDRLADAEPLARRALDIRRRAGTPAPATAEALSTLGLIRHLRGGLDGARMAAEAVDLWRVSTGVDSFEFASGMSTLARNWHERADYLKADRMERAELLKAERFARELLVARRNAFGDVHVLTAISLQAVGQLQAAMGRHVEAEPMLREALAARRQLPGGDATLPAIEAAHALAQTLHDQGHLTEAEPLYRQSIAGLRQALASGRIDQSDPKVTAHPHLAVYINNLATLLQDAGRPGEAEAGFREALTLRRAIAGSEHPGVARTANNLARLLLERGRAAEALLVADEALRIRRAAAGEADFETVSSIVLRGAILGALGRRADAEPALSDGLASSRRLLPADNLHVATAAAEYGRWLLENGRPNEAEPLLREALAARTAHLPATHWTIGEARVLLGATLVRLGRVAEGQTVRRSGLDVLGAALPAGDPRARALMKWLN